VAHGPDVATSWSSSNLLVFIALQTALHFSVSSGNYDIVNLLLNKGASVNVKNNAGRSPLDEAKDNVAIRELLNKHLRKNKRQHDFKSND
jgi:ankyrin repeat protein